MSQFDVEIRERSRVTDSGVSPGGVGSVVRSVVWSGEADNRNAAEADAWVAWDEKYGTGQRPDNPIVRFGES